MSMVIKNNLQAGFALRETKKNTLAAAKDLKKLSSGLKINDAGDDASGYAISEKMRAQIRSLDQDFANCQNGISMLKVAEGAVDRSVEILRTLKEKAINAANDTNTDEDRAIIQKELDKAIDQIDENAMVSFNGMTLLDGTKESPSETVEEHIIKALHTEIIPNALNLIEESLGINFQGMHAYVQFYNSGAGETGIGFSINMGRMGTLDLHDLANVDGIAYPLSVWGRNEFDRNFAGDLAGLCLAWNAWNAVNSDDATKLTIINEIPAVRNGLAELVVGADDVGLPNPSAVTIASLTGSEGEPPLHGYMAFRYLAHQSGNEQNAIKKFVKIYTGELDVDKATAYASGGKFKSWTDLAKKFVADVATVGDSEKFLREYCGIIINNDDVGSITGSDVGGSKIIKNSHTVVPEGGSTRFWYSPSSNFTVYDGWLTVHWNTEGMHEENKQSMKTADGEEVDITGLYKTSPPYAGKVGNMSLQVGTKANQAIKFGFFCMTAEGLGLQDTQGNKISVATRDHAKIAIGMLDNSLRKALTQQTNIGALQSRLEYTAANLVTASENTQAAESTIRDADMAKAAVNFAKDNVLAQASQSMLAQANQNSSSVLSLLQ